MSGDAATDHPLLGRSGQSGRFLALYALAVCGSTAAYAPFLNLFLPMRVPMIAGDGAAAQALSYVALIGAIAASIANIIFGWASDRSGNRTIWIAAGLAGSTGLLMLMDGVRTVPQLLVMIIAWQSCLNMMLAPLAALAGDCVPHEQKGLLGGLLSIAPGAGALVGIIVTTPGLASDAGRLMLTGALVCAMVLPLLVLGRPRPMPHLMSHRVDTAQTAVARTVADIAPVVPVWRMWTARLLVQVAEATLFAFLLLWLHGRDASISDHDVATIFTLVLFVAVPVALLAGRWSDRAGRPMRPLVVAAACATVGLAIMTVGASTAAGTGVAIAGYMLFGVCSAVFLALHGGQTLRVLIHARTRGRDLGLFNLTNTMPSMLMPALTLTLIPLFGYAGLFAALAICVGSAALLLASSPATAR